MPMPIIEENGGGVIAIIQRQAISNAIAERDSDVGVFLFVFWAELVTLLGDGRTVRTVPDLEVLAVTSPAEPEKSLNAIDGSVRDYS